MVRKGWRRGGDWEELQSAGLKGSRTRHAAVIGGAGAKWAGPAPALNTLIIPLEFDGAGLDDPLMIRIGWIFGKGGRGEEQREEQEEEGEVTLAS